HLFPLFHRFKGGKGVATAAGVLFGLDVWLGLGSLATWIVIAAFFRYASLASLVAALFAPLFAWYIGLSYDMLLVVTSIAALLAWRHKGNMGRLFAGTASKKARAMSAWAAGPACLASVTTAVLSPEKLNSRSPLPIIGRGSR